MESWDMISDVFESPEVVTVTRSFAQLGSRASRGGSGADGNESENRVNAEILEAADAANERARRHPGLNSAEHLSGRDYMLAIESVDDTMRTGMGLVSAKSVGENRKCLVCEDAALVQALESYKTDSDLQGALTWLAATGIVFAPAHVEYHFDHQSLGGIDTVQMATKLSVANYRLAMALAADAAVRVSTSHSEFVVPNMRNMSGFSMAIKNFKTLTGIIQQTNRRR